MMCILNKRLCIEQKTFLAFLALGIVFFIWSNYFAISKKHIQNAKDKVNIIIQQQPQQSQEQPIFQQRINNKLRAPYKSNDSFPYTIPINIRTRGVLPEFQQVGYIHDESNTNVDAQRLPLMSRPKWYGSTEYESYVVDGSRNAIKIPLTNKKEISDSDTVDVNSLNGNYTAQIYDNDEPRYLPYI